MEESKDLEIPKDINPVLRFKSKTSGETNIKDLVQGEINISNSIIRRFCDIKARRFTNLSIISCSR